MKLWVVVSYVVFYAARAFAIYQLVLASLAIRRERLKLEGENKLRFGERITVPIAPRSGIVFPLAGSRVQAELGGRLYAGSVVGLHPRWNKEAPEIVWTDSDEFNWVTVLLDDYGTTKVLHCSKVKPLQ